MADLSTFASAAAARSEILTKGSGVTPIRDGDDDPYFYEEGTWTPEYVPENNSFDEITYGSQIANYARLGNLVFIDLYLETASLTIGAASGRLEIQGLPYTVKNTGSLPAGQMGRWDYTNIDILSLWLTSNTIRISNDPAGDFGHWQVSNMREASNSNRLRASGTYIRT